MKHLAWLPAALLAGLVIGSWAPRLELTRSREELKRLQDSLQQSHGRENDLQGVLRMLRLDLEGGRSGPGAGENREQGGRTGLRVRGESGADGQGELSVELSDRRGGDLPRGEEAPPLREQIERAADLWRVRADLARESFVERARLSREEAAQFDVVLAAMNVRLEDTIDDWVTRFEQDEELTPEVGLRLMHELSGVLVLTYDEMDRTLPVSWRRDSGGVELIDHIDPAVALPLLRVEDRIQRELRSGEERTP